MKPWYTEANIYHIYSLSQAGAPFRNESEEQSHRLGELEAWIPHIREMGCNAVLLSPVLKSLSHGYDVTDYRTIDNRLGTNEEFRDLVAAFHRNGIRVILDSVFNHCGRDFWAFRQLREGNRDYASWFSGVDFGRQSPLGDPFTYDTWSGYYELVKFNLSNPQVRGYLLDSAKFWIEFFDIDGMRLDSANVLDFGFMRELRSVTTGHKPDFWLMGEVVGGDYTRWVDGSTLHSVTNYILFKSLFSSHNDNNLYELAHCVQQSRPENGLPLYNFLDNHDQPRIASNVNNPAHLFTLYALLYTLPGIPSLYYGSEWGISGKKENGSDQPLRPCLDLSHPPEGNPELTRWIQLLAAIRANSKALRHGSYKQVFLAYHKPLVFERSFEEERVVTAVHIGDEPETINLAVYGLLRDLISGEEVSPDQLTLAPHTARIFLVI